MLFQEGGDPAQHMSLIHCQILPFVKTRIYQMFPQGDEITAEHEVKKKDYTAICGSLMMIKSTGTT